MDIWIENGMVWDSGTGCFRLKNIGIREGKIVAVTEETLPAHTVIDAKESWVVPAGKSFFAGNRQLSLGMDATIMIVDPEVTGSEEHCSEHDFPCGGIQVMIVNGKVKMRTAP